MQSADEVWNANFMRIEGWKETERKNSWGSVHGKTTKRGEKEGGKLFLAPEAERHC